jgi:hypothetical protein
MRARLSATVVAFCLLAGCGDDGLSPRDVAGAWVFAGPRPTEWPSEPDTLVIDGRGGGRIAQLWTDFPPGGTPTFTWLRGEIRYRLRGEEILLTWCLERPGYAVDCAPGYHSKGTLDRDGALWIGPTSLASSLSAQPWTRVGR